LNRRTTLLFAALAALPLSAGAIADGKSKPKPPKPKYFKSVAVGDNFYAPLKLTVKPNTQVTWRWPNEVGDTHDVKFQRGPKGVPHYQSEPAAAEYRYAKLLTKLGTYRIICTFHEGEMEQTIVVRK
jgi:plastocyanin